MTLTPRVINETTIVLICTFHIMSISKIFGSLFSGLTYQELIGSVDAYFADLAQSHFKGRYDPFIRETFDKLHSSKGRRWKKIHVSLNLITQSTSRPITYHLALVCRSFRSTASLILHVVRQLIFF